jgi:hypothetical protein
MPTISVFYGIVIRCSSRIIRRPTSTRCTGDTEPASGSRPANSSTVSFLPRAVRLVREWAMMHQPELKANWQRAERMQLLEPIEPLP